MVVSPSQAFEVVALQDVQQLQHSETLPVRWELPYYISSIVGRDRTHPFRMVVSVKVLPLKITTVLLRILQNFSRDVATVKSVPTVCRDLTVRFRESWVLEDFSLRGRAPVG